MRKKKGPLNKGPNPEKPQNRPVRPLSKMLSASPACESAAGHIAHFAMHAPNAGIVNVCSGQPTEVHAIVREWLQSWGADIQLERGVHSYPDYEPFAFWGSVRKLHAMLGQP